jgi:glucokinase
MAAGDKTRTLCVGVDVGGTNIAAALVDPAGRVLARHRNRTPRDQPAERTIETIAETIRELLEGAGAGADALCGIGLGVAGVVDTDAGLVVMTPNMNLTGQQIVGPLKERFGAPVVLGNDVDVGTLGERWLGAARGAQDVVGIFVGTGIGGGVICNGRLVRGARLAAGEIGHIVMEIDGPLCGCGNRGCLEAIASRTAIDRDIRQAVEAGRKSVVTELLGGDPKAQIRSSVLKKALKRKDPLVTEVMERAARVLGYACLTVRHLLDPEVIVLGGGVIEACGDFVVPIVEEVVDADALPGAREGGDIVESTLGDDAGVLGAVALARQHLGLPCNVPVEEVPSAYPVLATAAPGELAVDIRADGRVKKRKKSVARELYGTPHRIGPKELARACKGDPETLIIGTGHSGEVELTDDGQAFLKERGIRFRAVPTPQAVQEYNKAEGRKAAIVHVTC